MKKYLIVAVLLLVANFIAFPGGVQEEPETIIRTAVPSSVPAEELDNSMNDPVSFQSSYPDENIFNILGRNTVKSGFPYSIFGVFEELSTSYDPVIIYWEFIPFKDEIPITTSEPSLPTEVEVINQELINYAREHIGISRSYDILETYDPAMANIIIMVECGKQQNRVTEKISIIFYNFNYKLITPSDQIVIGRSKACLIKESYYDLLNMEFAEKTLADIWY